MNDEELEALFKQTITCDQCDAPADFRVATACCGNEFFDCRTHTALLAGETVRIILEGIGHVLCTTCSTAIYPETVEDIFHITLL